MVYEVRLNCETEIGDGKGWHYWKEEQTTVDENIPCGDHPAATTRDFVVEEENP